MPTVSIGLPVVKDQFVKSAIEGALGQTYGDFEIIVLNNARDHEVKKRIFSIVDGFTDPRIKYAENSFQLPMIPNWNETLKNAQGEFFSLLSDDDRWAPSYLEEMLRLAAKYPKTNIFHCRMVVIDEHDNPIDLAPLFPEHQDYLDFIYHRIKGYSKFTLSDFLLRTEALRRIGGFVEMLDGWGSDDITWFHLGVDGGISYSPEPLYYYRENSFNVSNAKGIKNKYRSINTYVNYVKKIIASDTRSCPEFRTFKRNLVLQQLEIYRKKNCAYLVDKGLRDHRYIPEALVPFMMLFFKSYKKVFGW